MTQKDAMLFIASFLETLRETKGSPESTFYIFLGCDMRKWEALKGIMLKASLVNIRGNFVTLTVKGQEVAEQLHASTQNG